ncbi:MAG: hypothetical protein KDE23_28545, partial [Caldilinea sp.]|nr:hypothetical protein [Caldilinea sp.]
TNTDAVLMDGRTVLGWAKAPTTGDVSGGITRVLTDLMTTSQVAPAAVDAVMLGTTHFTNAVVERRALSPTAVVRIGLPATASLPPFVDWPADLVDALGGQGFLVHGGYEFDGRPIAPLDDAEIRLVAQQIHAAGITSVAVSGVFSPVNADQEQHVAALLADVIPDVRVSLSHEIGRIGLLERENA